MMSCSQGPRRLLLALAPALAFPAVAFAQCPTLEQVGASVQQIFKRPGIETKKISPSPLKGLCEVQVSLQGRSNVFYADEKGDFFLMGNLIETKSGKNLTEETTSALNAIAPEDLPKLEGLVAMTLGDKGKTVYFATDPQ